MGFSTTLRQGSLVVLSVAVLSACEKTQDNAGPLGTPVSQDGKAAPGSTY